MPRTATDLTGRVFTRLTVLRRDGTQGKSAMYIVQCSCPAKTIKRVAGNDLTRTRWPTRSCGCYIRDITSERSLTHGHTTKAGDSETYIVWRNMIRRCDNPKDKSYPRYGARGIKVCKRWYKFENFLIDMGERPKDMQIERKNNDKGYYKSNCKWSTRKEQGNNRITNTPLRFDGRKQTLTEWAEEKGMLVQTLWRRLNKSGWSVKKALTTPVR